MKKSFLLIVTFIGLLNQSFSQNVNITVSPLSRGLSDYYGLNSSTLLYSNTDLANTNVIDGVKKSKASYLRFPGGTDANYWDWQEGWFFRNLNDNGPISMDVDFQKRNRLTSVFNGSNLRVAGSDYLSDYVTALASTGTKSWFVVNPLTSDIYYQVAMLLDAKSRNLNPTKIEIGNEFYLSRTAYQEKFANSVEYANLVASWNSTIKNFLGGSASVSAVAANDDHFNSTNDRRFNWNPSLYGSLSSNLPDAFSIHQYKSTNLSTLSSTYASDYKSIFGKVNDDQIVLKSYVDQLGGVNDLTPIWISEYNLFETNPQVKIHGTWYHDLYTAYNALKFLEIKRISNCNLHAMSGNFVFANFYWNATGLNGDATFAAPPCSLATDAYGRTSSGIAMDQIALAFQGATSASQLSFSNIPSTINLSDGSSPIYGWKLLKGSGAFPELVILNLSNTTITNVIVSGLGFTTGDQYTQLKLDEPDRYAGANPSSGNPNQFNMVSCNALAPAKFIDITPHYYPTNNKVDLPPFSITRLYTYQTIANPQVYALKDTINPGTNVLITTTNKEGYSVLWSTGDSTDFINVQPTVSTNYTATFTSNLDGSTINKTIPIIIPPVGLTVTISATTSINCPSVSLTALGHGGVGSNYKYIWITTPVDDDIPDFNHGIGAGSTISVQPTIPTTYTVYVTDGTLVGKTSYTVNVPSSIDLKPEYTFCTSATGNSLIPFITTGTIGVVYNYTWQGITHALGSSTVSIPTSSTSLSDNLIINSTYNGCTISKSVKINFFDCCNPGARLEIQPSSDLNSLIPANIAAGSPFTITETNNGPVHINCNNVTGTDIVFHGDFHITDHYISGDDFNTGLEFEKCNVSFSEGASITTEPDFKLKLQETNLDAACSNKLWKGIIMDAGSLDARKTWQGVTGYVSIKNAEMGINSLPGSTISLRGVDLTNNIIGLNSTNTSVLNKNLQFITILNSHFESITGTPLYNPYAGQLTAVGTTPMAGIYFKKVVGVIGNTSNGSNSFKGLNAGIIALGSALTINNSWFKDIFSDPSYHLGWGTGILAYNQRGGYSFLTYNGQLANTSVVHCVDNCKTGIQTDETDLKVQYADMNDVSYGIAAYDNILSSINIAFNTIHSNYNCIGLINNDLSPQVNVVYNNLFTSNAETNDGCDIRIWEFNNRKENKHLNINCNALYVDNGRTGFEMIGVDYLTAIQNSILQSVPDLEQYAIYSQKSDFCTFRYNGGGLLNGSHYNLNSGFSFQNCEGNAFFQNHIQNTLFGFEFTGNCFHTDFNENTMNNHDKGLHLYDKAFIDPQNDKANRWYGNYPLNSSQLPIAADNLNTIVIDVTASLFTVPPQIGTTFTPNVEPSIWFDPSGSNTNVTAGVIECKFNQYEKFIPEYSDQRIIAGKPFDSVFYSESKINATKSLYEKLYTNDSLLNSSTAYINFEDSVHATSSGKLSEIRLNLGKTNELISTFQEQCNNYSFATEMSLLDSLAADSESIINYGLYNKVYEVFYLKDSLYKSFDNALTQSLIATDFNNTSISTSDQVNQNEKEVNALLIKYRLKTIVDYTQYERELITSIASQCPREGGAPVYRARTMMYSINPYLHYNDNAECNTIIARRGKIETNNFEDYGMLPDRQKNLIRFNNSAEIRGALTITIYDLQGKCIENTIINGEKNSWLMNFNHPKDQFYLIHLSDANQQQQSFKLVW